MSKRPLMIQGTSSGAGKTVLVAALCRIFSDQGYSVAPFKSQNMSNLSYEQGGIEISRAQAVQAIGARCQITADLNPILLKPLGGNHSAVFLNGKPYSKRMHASRYYSGFVLERGLGAATGALRRLKRDHDLVILEGAGSPAEINLHRYDIANMRMASRAQASVVLVADIDRGGAFASLAGTMSLMDWRHRRRVRGLVFNKFRGDIGILRPGFGRLARITGAPILGAIPMVRVGLPEEDSLGASRPRGVSWDRRGVARIDREISKLAKTVKENIDMRQIEAMIGR